MKFLVLGGSYFIGKSIARSLAELGETFVLNRGTKELPDKRLTLIRGDRTDPESLYSLRDHQFDVIIDVSAESQDFMANTLPHLTRSTGAKYIYISSGSVFRDECSAKSPAKEGDPIGGAEHWGDYGAQKSKCELLLERADFRIYILRPPYVYGPENSCDREQFIWARTLSGKPVYIPDSAQTVIQFISVFDVARIVAAIAMDANEVPEGVYNIGESNYYSFEEYISVLAKAADHTTATIPVESEIPARTYFPFRANTMALDVAKAERVFGQCRDLFSGMKETYRWFEQNNQIKYSASEFEKSRS